MPNNQANLYEFIIYLRIIKYAIAIVADVTGYFLSRTNVTTNIPHEGVNPLRILCM